MRPGLTASYAARAATRSEMACRARARSQRSSRSAVVRPSRPTLTTSWSPTSRTVPRAGGAAPSRSTHPQRPPLDVEDATGVDGRAGIQASALGLQATYVTGEPGVVPLHEPRGLRERRAAGQDDDDLTGTGHGQARAPRPIGAPHDVGMAAHAGRGRRRAGSIAMPGTSAILRGGAALPPGQPARRGSGAGRVPCRARGDSSAGRASAWQAEGPGFESPSLHHPTRSRTPVTGGGLVVPDTPRAGRMSENAAMTSPSDLDIETSRPRIDRYDPAQIEPRWQQRWEELGLHDTDLADDDAPRLLPADDVPLPVR